MMSSSDLSSNQERIVGANVTLAIRDLTKHVQCDFDAAMRKWSDANCLPAKRPAIEVMETDGTPAARLQLKQGRVDAIVQSSESVPYTMAQEPGVYTKIGKALTAQKIVIAFPKRSAALRDAVASALRAAVKDGSYAKALAKHGLEDNSFAEQISAP